MTREHELGYAEFQLERVLRYLPICADAPYLIRMAKLAVHTEHNLLEAVRVYKETHK